MMKNSRKAKDWIVQLIYLCIGLVVISPIVYAFFVSIMEPSQILSRPPRLFPKTIYLGNYKKALSYTTLERFMINSFIMAFVSSIVRIITGSLAAFAFSFFEFPFKKPIFFLFIGSVMIPADVVLVTNYTTVSKLGLVNTYLGMMILFFVSALNIFMMRQYFLTFSTSLKEAAYIDGCGNFKFYCKILLPSSTPILTTIFISAFVGTWNTYLWPLIVTNKNSMRTVQVGITMLNFPDETVHGPIMAASILVLIPSIIIFLIFQKRIVSGIMIGSVKG